MALTRQERQARYRERRRLRLAAPSAVALAMSGVPSEQLDGFHRAVRERVQAYLADLGGIDGLAETKVMQVRSLVEAELVLEPMSRDVQALTQAGQLWSLRSRRAAALLADWLRMKEHRDRLLVAVGLTVAQPAAPSLVEIAERIAREREGQEPPQSHEGAEAAGHGAAVGLELCAWREGGDQGPGDPAPEQAPEGGQGSEPDPVGEF